MKHTVGENRHETGTGIELLNLTQTAIISFSLAIRAADAHKQMVQCI